MNGKDAMPAIYNKKSAAKMLGISVETLDRYKAKGKPRYIIRREESLLPAGEQPEWSRHTRLS